MTTANQLAGYASSLPNFRNRIINGDMRIDQRNAGASISTASVNPYTVDRWQVSSYPASKFTAQQNAGSVTPPAGFSYYLGITSSSSYAGASTDQMYIYQNFEGHTTSDLSFGTAYAKTVTISFWVRSSLTGTFGGALRNYAGTRSYPFTYTISTTNTWEQKTVSIVGDTSGTWVGASNAGSMILFINLGTGTDKSGSAGSWASADYRSATGATSVVGTSGATFYITGVQLEEGTVATPFEHRPYGLELSLCQRYYATSIPKGYTITDFPTGADGAHMIASGSNDLFGYVPFPVEMRAAPATYIYSSTNRASGKVRNGATGTDHTISSYQPQSYNNKSLVYFSGVSSATSAGQHFTFHYVASAEL